MTNNARRIAFWQANKNVRAAAGMPTHIMGDERLFLTQYSTQTTQQKGGDWNLASRESQDVFLRNVDRNINIIGHVATQAPRLAQVQPKLSKPCVVDDALRLLKIGSKLVIAHPKLCVVA